GIQDQKGIALEINGVADHIHILAKVRPDRCISDILRDVKARSSGWIHREFPHLGAFAWQTGYGAFSVGGSQTTAVRNYIRNQQAHHEAESFETEFIKMLEA